MLILSTIALPLAAIGYSLVYLLAGGGFFGAIVIFIVAKMLGDCSAGDSPRFPFPLVPKLRSGTHPPTADSASRFASAVGGLFGPPL